MAKPRRYLAVLAAALCAQAALSMAYVLRAPVTLSEAEQLRRIETLRTNEPPLYYRLASPLAAPVEGRSETARASALRFLNVLFGLGTTVFVYLLALRVAGERSAVYCALFSAFLPQHLYASATLGPAELGAMLSTASLYLGARHLYKKRRAWLGPAVGVVLGLAILAGASGWATALAYALCAGAHSQKDDRGFGRLAVGPLVLAVVVGIWPYGREESFVPSASDFSAVDFEWLVRLARGSLALFRDGLSEIPAPGYALAFTAVAAGLAGFAQWEHEQKPWRLEPAWHLALASLLAGMLWAFVEAAASVGPDGRVFLPVLGPAALVLVSGWRALTWPLSPGTRSFLRLSGAGALALIHYWAYRAL